jgi:hypothetical protein
MGRRGTSSIDVEGGDMAAMSSGQMNELGSEVLMARGGLSRCSVWRWTLGLCAKI